MTGKRVFLQWSLFMCLVAIGAFIAADLGWIGYLKRDPTHITLLTLTVFVLATAWLGRLSWRFSNGDDPEELEHELDHGWFASSLCVSIGLIGTAVGYYLMLKNGDSVGDPQEVIRNAFANTSVAIINTVFGAVCGVIVEVQSHFIGHPVRKAAKLAREEAEKAAKASGLEPLERLIANVRDLEASLRTRDAAEPTALTTNPGSADAEVPIDVEAPKDGES